MPVDPTAKNRRISSSPTAMRSWCCARRVRELAGYAAAALTPIESGRLTQAQHGYRPVPPDCPKVPHRRQYFVVLRQMTSTTDRLTAVASPSTRRVSSRSSAPCGAGTGVIPRRGTHRHWISHRTTKASAATFPTPSCSCRSGVKPVADVAAVPIGEAATGGGGKFRATFDALLHSFYRSTEA